MWVCLSGVTLAASRPACLSRLDRSFRGNDLSASASRCGVIIGFWPYPWRVSGRMSSEMTRRTLCAPYGVGSCFGAGAGVIGQHLLSYLPATVSSGLGMEQGK